MDTHPIETITSLIRAAQAAGKAFAAGKTPDKIDAGVEDAVSAANDEFVAAAHFVGKAEARGNVVLIVGDQVCA